jgi:hypothetical protein
VLEVSKVWTSASLTQSPLSEAPSDLCFLSSRGRSCPRPKMTENLDFSELSFIPVGRLEPALSHPKWILNQNRGVLADSSHSRPAPYFSRDKQCFTEVGAAADLGQAGNNPATNGPHMTSLRHKSSHVFQTRTSPLMSSGPFPPTIDFKRFSRRAVTVPCEVPYLTSRTKSEESHTAARRVIPGTGDRSLRVPPCFRVAKV